MKKLTLLLLSAFLIFPPLAFAEHGKHPRYQIEATHQLGAVFILDAHTGAVSICSRLSPWVVQDVPELICSKWERPEKTLVNGVWMDEAEAAAALAEQEAKISEEVRKLMEED